MMRALAAVALMLLPGAAPAGKAKSPEAPVPEHPEWEKIFTLQVRSGLGLDPEDWADTLRRVMSAGCKDRSADSCREFQEFILGKIQDLVRDPETDDCQRTRILENTMSAFCSFSPGPACEALLASAADLAVDDAARAKITFLKAAYVQRTDRGNPNVAAMYMSVLDQYPAADAAAESLRALQQLCDQDRPGGSAGVDPKRLAALEEKFIRANPKHDDAGLALLDLSSRSGSAGLTVSQLRAVAEVYRASNPDQTWGLLGRLFRILDNLEHPYRSLGETGLFLLSPILIFGLARRRFFHPEDPGRGPLTLRGVKVLFWVLTVLFMLVAGEVMKRLCPGEILLIKFFGRPLEFAANGAIRGEKAVFMALILTPVTVLMVMNFSVSLGAMARADAARALPWWLPQDYARLLVAIWAVIGGGSALALYLIFGGDYIFAGVALAASLMIPLFYASIALISPLYGVGPMPEGPVRGFIRDTFARAEVPLKEIYGARSSLKMIEWLLVANVWGPVRCYLDPELLQRFTKNEFQAVILHQIGHLKGNHRLKLFAASSAVAAVVLAQILAGSLVPRLNFLIPGFFTNLMVAAAIIGLGRWERSLEREADAFVIAQTGRFQDHINAIFKLAGLEPASVDLARIKDSPAFRPETKRRILHILDRWYQAQAPTLPPQNP